MLVGSLPCSSFSGCNSAPTCEARYTVRILRNGGAVGCEVIRWRHVNVQSRRIGMLQHRDARPWDPVTLGKEGANSDAAAAVIVEREEQHRENVGVEGATVFCDKEGKHSGVIHRSAK